MRRPARSAAAAALIVITITLFALAASNRAGGIPGAKTALEAAQQQLGLTLAAALCGAAAVAVTAVAIGRRVRPVDIDDHEPATPAANPAADRARRVAAPAALAVLLIVGGAIGLLAAYELTSDKIAILQNPAFIPSCNISPFLTCSRNLKSSQGAIFGFPNPLLGLLMFPAPIVVGIASLAGVGFPRQFWALFNLGLAFAIGFVIWLISVSLFTLGTLCPWCMAVWASVIPMSIATTLFNIRYQALPLGNAGARAAAAALSWTPLLTLAAYVLFAVAAQTQLDVLHRI